MTRKKTTVNTYNLFMSLYFLIVFGYVFNHFLFAILPFSKIIIPCLTALAAILVTAANAKYITKKRTPLLLSISIVIGLILFRNGEVLHGTYTSTIFTLFLLYSIYILSFTNRWHKIALKIFNLFVLEHILGTFFCFLFPDFYFSHILPLYPSYSRELLYQFNHNQIAGITNHYGQNALYLVSGLLINVPIFINKKQRRLVDYLFLLSGMVALLLTGKRSQVISFIVVTLIILALKYRHHLLRFAKKIILIAVVGVGGVLLLANFIPNITNSFTRAYASLSDESSMNSRNALYDLALEEFEAHPLIGIGWNGYRYEYNLKMTKKERDYMMVHNIYLQTLCEIGVLGCFLLYSIFIILIYLTFKDLFAAKDPQALDIILAFTSFLIFFLLEGVLGNSLYELATYAPFSIFCAMYLYYHYQLKAASTTKSLEPAHA